MNKDAYIAKGINVSTTTLLGNSYIYIENRREILKLNEVGSYLWGNINGTGTISKLIKKCQDDFDGDKNEIESTVMEFIKDLLNDEVVKISLRKFKGVMLSA